MTIAEKLTTIAENVPKVYEAGKEYTAEKLKPYIEDISLKKLYEEGNFILGGMSSAVGDISDKQYTSFGGTDTIKISGYVDLELNLISPIYKIIIDDVVVQERNEFSGGSAEVLFEYKGNIKDSIKLAELHYGTTQTFNRFLIRPDYAEGYEEGYEVGKAEGGDTTEAYNNGFIDGQKSEYDRFWDTFQENGNKVRYLNTFSGNGWSDDVYDPKYPIVATSAATMLFQNNANITSTKVPITISVAAASVFNGCNALIEILSLKVTDKVTFTAWFNSCKKLETINFTEDSVIAKNIDFSPCTRLSDASLESIIGALGGTDSATLTLPSKFNTDEYADIIASKPSNWTIAYL